MKLSKRINKTNASPIRKFVPLANQAEKSGVKVYYLNIGQPDLRTPSTIIKSLKNYQQNPISYAPSTGFEETRKAWGEYFKKYRLNYKAEEILITNGASEALIWLFITLCDPGDEVLVFEPFYTNYKSFASAVNVKLVPVTCRVEDNFALPSDKAIEKKITKRTKAVIICNPNNPTGTLYNKKAVSRLVKIVKKYRLWLISDETYREMVFNQKDIISLYWWPEIRQQLIITDSVSKRFSFCGGRVGCLASKNRTVIENCLKLAQARLSASSLEQMSVLTILKNPKTYTAQLVKEYKRRADVVYQALNQIPGVVCRQPQGAFYIIASLPIDDAEKFVSFMLARFRYQKQTVMVTPAADFYATPGLGKKEIRIAYVLNTKELKKAMVVLQKGLEEYNNISKLKI